MSMLHFVECPRDAMQGWPHMIPTDQKVAYLNQLLKVGFNTLDFGSFVSPKAIPQMADTAKVLPQLQMQNNGTQLLAIVANLRGATEAVQFDEISYLGFPFSISETFQQRNTHSSIAESVQRVDEMQNLCLQHNKKLVIYLSMGFGNPYGDPYNEEILLHWADVMVKKNIEIISLADTVGVAKPDQIATALNTLIPQYPTTQIGVHLHCTPDNWQNKLSAAMDAGCQRFDGAMKGIGGCPMADDELVGNMDTEKMIAHFQGKNLMPLLNEEALLIAGQMATQLFI
jgi:hydroxymethylglutaryl-CoA lyase